MIHGNERRNSKKTNSGRKVSGCACCGEEISALGEEEPKPTKSIREKILAAYIYYRSLGAVGLFYDILIVTIALLAGGLLIGAIIFFGIVYK